MQKAPNRDSQPPNQRKYLSFPVLSILTPKVLGVLSVVFGTACTCALTGKPQQIPIPTTSIETALQLPIAQPTASETVTNLLRQGKPQLKKQAAIFPESCSPKGSSWDYINAILTSNQLPNQKRQQALNNLSWRVGNFGQQQLVPLKRSPQQQSNPTPSPQVAVGLQTSSERVFEKSWVNPKSVGAKHSESSLWDLPKMGRPNASPLRNDNSTFQTRSERALPSAVTLNPVQASQNQQIHTFTQVISQAQLPEAQQPSQVVETNPKPINTESAQQVRTVKLTLSDVVVLALENNRPIKNAYLERIAQRQDLAVAESKFSPNFTPSVSISLAQFGANSATTNSDLGLEATVNVPTGGQLSFRWATSGQTLNSNGFLIDPIDNGFGQNFQLSFNQPLLRGAGINVNKASVDIARLTEQVNILDLKATLINTITDAIIAYRELLRAQERLKIARISLKSAQDFLEITRFLIEVGRLAPVDIVQSETDVANRQVSLTEAENRLDAARLALLNILDIDQNIAIALAEAPTASPVSLDSNNLRQLAFENRPEYLKAQLNIDRTKLALLQAENNRLWDLNLNTSYGVADSNTSDVRVGLGFSRTLGDLTEERDFQRSRVNQLQAENTLEEERESLEIQVADNIRNVNLSFAQVELARKATTSSERQLEIAREKQRLGRPITVFELVRLQNDLEQARNVELNATIDYLNALTRLDQVLGTTLDTWQVTIERK